MEGSKKCAEYLLTKNVERCMNEIKKRWVSYNVIKLRQINS